MEGGPRLWELLETRQRFQSGCVRAAFSKVVWESPGSGVGAGENKRVEPQDRCCSEHEALVVRGSQLHESDSIESGKIRVAPPTVSETLSDIERTAVPTTIVAAVE